MEGLVDREVARDRLIDKSLTLLEEEKQAALRVYTVSYTHLPSPRDYGESRMPSSA